MNNPIYGTLSSRIAAQTGPSRLVSTEMELMSYMAGRGGRYDLARIEVFIQPDDVTHPRGIPQSQAKFSFGCNGI